MSKRPENEAHEVFLKAQGVQNEPWPEPETTQLYRTLVRGAEHIVVSVLGHSDRNLASEIGTRTLLRLRSYRGDSLFSTWFYRLARNEAIRAVTDSAPREEQFDEQMEPESAPHSPLFLPRGLTRADASLLRHILAGDSYDAIASKFGISKMSVSRRWDKLRKQLGELYGRRDGPHSAS